MRAVKVFGIGFHKTGTSSLGEALRILGYRNIANYTPDLLPAIQASDWETVYQFCDRHDAFQDNPWPLLYQQLDQRYPNSKFVLTYRPAEKWLQSVRKHFGGSSTAMREWIYAGHGDPIGQESLYETTYRQHIEAVKTYFSDRPQDLLILDWAKADGWEKLCPFLDVPIPAKPFPHTNAAKDRKAINHLKHRIKKFFIR
ncbi:MAG: sulfotransferase family protein [Bacteroidota bacterium]